MNSSRSFNPFGIAVIALLLVPSCAPHETSKQAVPVEDVLWNAVNSVSTYLAHRPRVTDSAWVNALATHVSSLQDCTAEKLRNGVLVRLPKCWASKGGHQHTLTVEAHPGPNSVPDISATLTRDLSPAYAVSELKQEYVKDSPIGLALDQRVAPDDARITRIACEYIPDDQGPHYGRGRFSGFHVTLSYRAKRQSGQVHNRFKAVVALCRDRGLKPTFKLTKELKPLHDTEKINPEGK